MQRHFGNNNIKKKKKEKKKGKQIKPKKNGGEHHTSELRNERISQNPSTYMHQAFTHKRIKNTKTETLGEKRYTQSIININIEYKSKPKIQ